MFRLRSSLAWFYEETFRWGPEGRLVPAGGSDASCEGPNLQSFDQNHRKPLKTLREERPVLSAKSRASRFLRANDLPEGAPHGVQPTVEKGGQATKRRGLIGRAEGGMNAKLHAVNYADGRPIHFFMTAGQVSDYAGAPALPANLPKANYRPRARSAFPLPSTHRLRWPGIVGP